MKKEEYRVGKNKIIWLEDVELEAFELLAKLKWLTVDQMYAYISERTDLKFSAYRTKFFKCFYEKGLVVPHKVKNGSFGQKNVYQIGLNGVKLLIKEGYLDEGFVGYRINKIPSYRYLDYHLATREIVIRTLALSAKMGLEVEYLFKMKQSILISNENVSIRNSDVILKYGDHYIHILLDKRVKNHSKMKEVGMKYIDLCKENPQQHHSIIFSVVDNSFNGFMDYKDNPDIRVKNMKEKLLSLNNLHQSNLNYDVASLAETHNLVYDLLKKYSPLVARSLFLNLST